jgi:hypothetical protein
MRILNKTCIEKSDTQVRIFHSLFGEPRPLPKQIITFLYAAAWTELYKYFLFILVRELGGLSSP